jgi:hypothetical protein
VEKEVSIFLRHDRYFLFHDNIFFHIVLLSPQLCCVGKGGSWDDSVDDNSADDYYSGGKGKGGTYFFSEIAIPSFG